MRSWRQPHGWNPHGQIYGDFGGLSEISAQIFEYFGGVVLGIGFGPGFYHPAVCADEYGNPRSTFLIGGFRGTVCESDGAVGIA
jgi:hypothetical protein